MNNIFTIYPELSEYTEISVYSEEYENCNFDHSFTKNKESIFDTINRIEYQFCHACKTYIMKEMFNYYEV